MKKKTKVKIKQFWLLGCSPYFTWEIQIERLHTRQHWCRGIVTPQTIMRLNPPSPPNPSENAGYLLLLSPLLHFPALTAGYCSTVCTLQSCWVKEKTAQVIRKQTNKNRLFLLSLPSSLNKATSQTVNHIVAIIWPYQKPVFVISFAVFTDKIKMFYWELIIIKYPLRQSFIFARKGSQDLDCCLQTTDFLEEGILTREKSCHMFDPNIWCFGAAWLCGTCSVLKRTYWYWK